MEMDEAAALAAKLQAQGEKLSLFMGGLSPTDWATEVYTEGTIWTVRSILAHLMTTERAFAKLFAQILDGGAGVSEDFVIDRYNQSQQKKTEHLPLQELLQQFEDARAAMVEFVRGLGSADLEKRGRHPFLGMTTLRDMVKMVYIHNQTHFRDIRRALRPE